MRAQGHPVPERDRHAPLSLPEHRAADSAPDLQSRLAQLGGMQPHELRAEWKRLYRAQPPKLSRDLMIKALAYRLQEIAQGGLAKSDARRLAALAETLRAGGRIAPDAPAHIRPGVRLVRVWHGRTHSVTVTETGFLYREKTYRSLTSIAREITGARWSGPRFFGLVEGRNPAMQGSAEDLDGAPAEAAHV